MNAWGCCHYLTLRMSLRPEDWFGPLRNAGAQYTKATDITNSLPLTDWLNDLIHTLKSDKFLHLSSATCLLCHNFVWIWSYRLTFEVVLVCCSFGMITSKFKL